LNDAENNRTTYEYDGLDGLVKTRFPSPIKGVGLSSSSDYEGTSYEAACNDLETAEKGWRRMGVSFQNHLREQKVD